MRKGSVRYLPVLFIVLALCVTGCTGIVKKSVSAIISGGEPDENASVSETAVSQSAAFPAAEPETTAPLPYYTYEERTEENGQIRSYLTGQMTDSKKAGRRPVAVMMSNDKQALPQYGINRAAIVYEAPVEGGMNRYMAILEDYDDLTRIGSVRSCRTYYTYFAKEFDAIYAHYGQSTFAKPYLKNLDHIDGIEGPGSNAYYRSKDRKMPHNAYTSFKGIQKAIEKLGFSQQYSDGYRGHYRFIKDGQEVRLSDGQDAYKVYPGYGMNKAYFSYSEEDGLYYRFQYGGPHKGDEGQIAVKNIIFQYCPSGFYATTEYLDINVHANENGYYFTNGKAIPVKWKKDGEFGVTHYYDTQENEIILNQGKTWVCIISTKDISKTEIYGKQ